MANGALLEDWYFTRGVGFAKSTDGVFWICGKIYNDDRFPDGAEVRTSRVTTIKDDLSESQTRNTRYVLGEPTERFVEEMGGGDAVRDIFGGFGK